MARPGIPLDVLQYLRPTKAIIRGESAHGDALLDWLEAFRRDPHNRPPLPQPEDFLG
jgi:hypothetical protein